MNLKALIEKRNAKIEETEKLVKLADTETRALTEEELKLFDELKAEIEALTKTITAIQQANALSVEEDEKSKDDKTEKATEEAETRAFSNYIRGVVTENRAETTLAMSDNGAVVPTTIANRIIKRINEICPIYQLATKYNVAGNLSLPYYDEETSSITVAYANEFTDLTSSAGSFKSIELKGFLAFTFH